MLHSDTQFFEFSNSQILEFIMSSCNYSLLSERSHGHIRWCKHCKNYMLTFNNIFMNFSPEGLKNFKEYLGESYDYHTKCPINCDKRDIFFKTKIEGMKFIFSIHELSELLSLIQEAEQNNDLPEGLGRINLN